MKTLYNAVGEAIKVHSIDAKELLESGEYFDKKPDSVEKKKEVKKEVKEEKVTKSRLWKKG